jgi:hypothetical protein
VLNFVMVAQIAAYGKRPRKQTRKQAARAKKE